jgi:multiple sugar transport system ATP-binding protein
MNFIDGRLSLEKGRLRFRGGGLDIELPLRPAAQAGAEVVLGEVVLGVRPEDVRVTIATESAACAAENRGRVKVVEPLGDQAVLHVEPALAQGASENSVARLTCKSPVRDAPQAGDAVRLEVDASRVHLFDAASGENLNWDG